MVKHCSAPVRLQYSEGTTTGETASAKSMGNKSSGVEANLHLTMPTPLHDLLIVIELG
jgi:hypothetical protein